MFVRGKVRNMPGLTGLRGMGRARGRKLGCSSCGGKRLGQTDPSIYDIQYGGGDTSAYDTGVVYSDPNVFNLPGLTAGPVYPSVTPAGGASSSWGASLPSAVASIFKPAVASNPNPYTLPGLTTGPVYPSSPSASSTPTAASSYLPYAILGLGALAVIVVMKHR